MNCVPRCGIHCALFSGFSLDNRVGVDCQGVKHVLGIWVQQTEGAKFWASVCAELANRGVQDVVIACVDGLTVTCPRLVSQALCESGVGVVPL